MTLFQNFEFQNESFRLLSFLGLVPLDHSTVSKPTKQSKMSHENSSNSSIEQVYNDRYETNHFDVAGSFTPIKSQAIGVEQPPYKCEEDKVGEEEDDKDEDHSDDYKRSMSEGGSDASDCSVMLGPPKKAGGIFVSVFQIRCHNHVHSNRSPRIVHYTLRDTLKIPTARTTRHPLLSLPLVIQGCSHLLLLI